MPNNQTETQMELTDTVEIRGTGKRGVIIGYSARFGIIDMFRVMFKDGTEDAYSLDELAVIASI